MTAFFQEYANEKFSMFLAFFLFTAEAQNVNQCPFPKT